jgi:glycosyltransferase involved in cell wall biosynthesis
MEVNGEERSGYFKKRFLIKNLDMYKDFKNVLVDTEHVKKQLIEYGFNGRITKINLPASDIFHPIDDKAILRRKLNLPLDTHLVLSVGGNASRKNLDLIKTLSSETSSSIKFVRVGPRLDGCYNFSQVEDTVLNMIYNACDVLILPSFYEGYGYPIVEAMRCGLPIACSDIAPFRELAEGCATFFDPHSTTDALKAINDSLSFDDRVKKKLLERSNNFTLEKYKVQMREYYKQVIRE